MLTTFSLQISEWSCMKAKRSWQILAEFMTKHMQAEDWVSLSSHKRWCTSQTSNTNAEVSVNTSHRHPNKCLLLFTYSIVLTLSVFRFIFRCVIAQSGSLSKNAPFHIIMYSGQSPGTDLTLLVLLAHWWSEKAGGQFQCNCHWLG